jgi:hypothetical protein
MKPITRRTFLGCGLGTAAGLGLGSTFSHARSKPAPSDLPMPCPPSAWQKHGVVLGATEPWEEGQVQNFTSPVEPIEQGRWRIWYSGTGKKFRIAYAEGMPGERMKKVPALCTPGPAGDGAFTIGHLPEGWNPTQVVHIHLRNGKHRVYFWAHGPGIARYLAADSEDGRHYTVVDPLRPVLYHPNDRASQGIPSPDGVLLTSKRPLTRPADEPAAVSRLISNDSTMVYQLPNGTFEMYSVALVPVAKTDPAYMPEDNAPGLLRVIDRYRSDDGLRFEDRRRVIQRDAGDPVDQQFYHLAVTYTPRGRVGMLGHYRLRAQTMDLEWCLSPDGMNWHRPARTAWLPRGSHSEPDSYGIYPPAGLVERDGKCHLFYTGVNSAHNYKHSYGPPRSVIMYATTESMWR